VLLSVSVFKPSKGFVDLVERFHVPDASIRGSRPEIPQTREELWAGFLFPMFIGGMRRSAQATYAVSVLEEYLSLAEARRAQTDSRWSVNIAHRLKRTLNGLGNTPPDGLKRSVLEDVLAEANSLRLANMAAGMASYIDTLDVSTLSKVRDNFDEEFNFVDSAVGNRAMPDVGYTKFVLWMHSSNIGLNLTPPSGPAWTAISSADIGFGGSLPKRWQEPEGADELGTGARQDFGMLCTWYRQLTAELRPRVDASLMPIDTQSAGWILGSTRSLLGNDRRATARFSASKLLGFVDKRGWTVADFSEAISDIDRCLDVIGDLKTTL